MTITMNEKNRYISVQQKSEVNYLKRNTQKEEHAKQSWALPRNFGVHRVLLPLYLGINNDTNW